MSPVRSRREIPSITDDRAFCADGGGFPTYPDQTADICDILKITILKLFGRIR